MKAIINRKNAIENTITISLNNDGRTFSVAINGIVRSEKCYLLFGGIVGVKADYVISDYTTIHVVLLDGEREILEAARTGLAPEQIREQDRRARVMEQIHNLQEERYFDFSKC